MSEASSSLVKALKAAGETTRLRILALLSHGDLAVGEFVQILGQSQPRLSHHLRTLSQAQLIERLPEGSWVFYRLASRGAYAGLLETIFDTVDLDEDQFHRDLEALEQVRRDRADQAETYFETIAENWDTLRSLHYPDHQIEQEILKIVGPGPFHRIVDLGTGTGRMLSLFGPHTKEAEGLDLSRQMLSIARTNLARDGVSNAKVRLGDARQTPFDSGRADLVIVHQVLHFLEDPAEVLNEASRLLAPHGKLLVVDFAPHNLEFLRTEHGHRRLGIRQEDMEKWTQQSQLELLTSTYFDPPDALDQGLRVAVWCATHGSSKKELAA